MTEQPTGARALAWRALQRWSKGGVFAETLVARAAVEYRLSHAERSLMQAIVFDTLRHLSLLDHWRQLLRSAPLEESARWLVMVGLCQLLLQHQAEHAAVGETVKLAPPRLRGLVNAMLRSAQRRRAEFEQELPTLRPAIRYSTPSWLVRRWMSTFGEEETLALLEWNNRIPPVYLRVNPLNPPLAIPDSWEPLPQVPLWYRLNGPLPLEALRAGQVYIADPATRYSVEMLAPQCGERVLDACAAPGGKSAAMLAATGGDIDLLATDAIGYRLPQLSENLNRAGGRQVQVAQNDWSEPCPEKWCGAFDAVLLDVPCSNSGVLQRRVDARWRMQPGEITRLAALQSRILEQGARAVRAGGRLVYSTCSIDTEEDHDVVAAFLSRHPEFRAEREHLVLPHREHSDGAYAALLVRA